MRLIVSLLTLVLCGAANAAAEPPVPERGQSMDTVIKHHGEPQQRLAPIGKPPITRWVYPGFTVYFEHRHAIHSVRHHERGPHPAPR